MLPGRSGIAPVRSLTLPGRSLTLPFDLAAFGTSRFEVPNTARSTGSVPDLALFTNLRSLMLPGRSGIAPMKYRIAPVRSGIAPVRSGTLPSRLTVLRTSKFEVRNIARQPGSTEYCHAT